MQTKSALPIIPVPNASPRVRAFWRALEAKDRATALQLLRDMRRDHQTGKAPQK